MQRTSSGELRRASIALLMLMTGVSAHAINKCTGPGGAVVYQDAPCAASSRSAEQVKTWDNTVGRREPIEADPEMAGPSQAAPLLDLYRRWLDAEKLAFATSRVALAGPVKDLQDLARAAARLSVPACVGPASTALQVLTKRSAGAALAFMQHQEVISMAYQLVDRQKLLRALSQELDRARCA